ncbi:hypothetical protein M514_02219, partial [Trichuris suis]
GNYAEVARRWGEHSSSKTEGTTAMGNVVAGFEARGSVEDAPRAGRPRCCDSQDRKRTILEGIDQAL